MKYKILIDTKKKRQLTNEEAEALMGALHNLGHKSGSITWFKVCASCGTELPRDFEGEICPNCEAGYHDSRADHNPEPEE